jgi:uncharacterized membrane protein
MPPDPQAKAGRKGYLDWLRGLAVLVMIEAHILDSWTRLDDRHGELYRSAMIIGGFGAPLFLFLAGVSVPLSAASKYHRLGDAAAASRLVMLRGLEIFGLAFLFRLQACILSWGPWWTLLKVDILNIMGPSIVGAAALWGWFNSNRARCIAFATATLALAFLTPPIRATPLLAALPDPLEAYLRPRPGLTNFVIFPWSGFVFAGALCGTLLADRGRIGWEQRIVTAIAWAGAVLAVCALGASYLPSPYPNSDFWTSSPSFFLLRIGILMALIGAAYVWELRPWRAWRFSPLEQMGRSSLFIYWIHIEMIYGLVVRPLHKNVSFPVAAIAIPIFGGLMLALSLAKDRTVKRFSRP